MGCGASKDGVSAPAEARADSEIKRKKKRTKDEEQTQQEEELRFGLLSTLEKHSDDLQKCLHAEVDQPAMTSAAMSILVKSPLDNEAPGIKLHVEVPQYVFPSVRSPQQIIAECKLSSPAVSRKSPVQESVAAALAATPATGSAAQSRSSSSRSFISPANSARAASVTAGDSKAPTPRINTPPEQTVVRSHSRSPVVDLKASRSLPASLGEYKGQGPGSRTSTPKGTSSQHPSERADSPAASLAALKASAQASEASRTTSPAPFAAESYKGVHGSRTPSRSSSPATFAELKPQSSRASSTQPGRSYSPAEVKTQGSRTSTPIEFKLQSSRTGSRVPSAQATETSRTTSPRVSVRTSTPAPVIPRSNQASRTQSPAVLDCKIELRKSSPNLPVAPSQEELRSQVTQAQPAELQERLLRPPSTEQQRKQLLTELAEKINSSRTSMVSLKDSKSSSRSSQRNSRAPSKSPANSGKQSRASSASSSHKASQTGLDEELSATAAAALELIVNSVVVESPTQQDQEAETSKSERHTEQDEDEDLSITANLESILSCVKCESTSAAATSEDSPRPGLLDYYLGLRSGGYKLSSPSSSASSRNMKTAFDDIDLTKEEFADSVASTAALDVEGIYNEIRKLKFSEYEKLEDGNNTCINGGTDLLTSATKIQVSSPLSSKGSAQEGATEPSILSNPRLVET